jgi:hypothetical protein
MQPKATAAFIIFGEQSGDFFVGMAPIGRQLSSVHASDIGER